MSEANKKNNTCKEQIKKNEIKSSGIITAINSNKKLNGKAIAFIKNSSLSLLNPEYNTGPLSSSTNTSKALFSLKSELESINKSAKRLKIRIDDNQ